ncbi:MAG: hypothetical protein IPL79_07015 [Myxococcales bacterium]|nr:hypothetical protein [Myxococcales bacterium]
MQWVARHDGVGHASDIGQGLSATAQEGEAARVQNIGAHFAVSERHELGGDRRRNAGLGPIFPVPHAEKRLRSADTEQCSQTCGHRAPSSA